MRLGGLAVRTPPLREEGFFAGREADFDRTIPRQALTGRRAVGARDRQQECAFQVSSSSKKPLNSPRRMRPLAVRMGSYSRPHSGQVSASTSIGSGFGMPPSTSRYASSTNRSDP